MFQPWRMQLRKANSALRGGRLEEAFELVSQDELREFCQAKQFMGRLAEELVRRGSRQAQQGDYRAAWRDYDLATGLAVDEQIASPLKGLIIERTLAEANDWIKAREPHLAIASLDDLLRRTPSPGAKAAKQLALKVQAATKSARRGDLALAVDQMASAACMRPELDFLAQQLAELRGTQTRFRELAARLHQSLADSDWHEVLHYADELLELAPEYEVAREARRRAWAAVNAKLDETIVVSHGNRGRRGSGAAASSASTRRDSACAVADPPQPGGMKAGRGLVTPEKRFLLWVDGVGAFLVCTGDRIRLGQPVPGNKVEVPIMGDISRNHATIRRDGEGYLIEARREVYVDGHRVKAVAALADGNVIQLGGGVQVRFVKPHPLSGTARLEFVTPHRTTPSSDAVLLMADTCVVGPQKQCHVVASAATGQTVLFRRSGTGSGELFCRSSGALEVDGNTYTGQAPLTTNSQIVADELGLSLEEI